MKNVRISFEGNKIMTVILVSGHQVVIILMRIFAEFYEGRWKPDGGPRSLYFLMSEALRPEILPRARKIMWDESILDKRN